MNNLVWQYAVTQLTFYAKGNVLKEANQNTSVSHTTEAANDDQIGTSQQCEMRETTAWKLRLVVRVAKAEW